MSNVWRGRELLSVGCLGSVVVAAAAVLLTVYTSGFLPASTDAKCVRVYGELRSIQTVIADSWCTGGQVLPTDWSSLEASEGFPDLRQVKDPFSDGAAELLSQLSEKRIIVWSVGPDGIDGLKVSSEEVSGKDEMVLIINQTEGKLETRILDFSLGERTSHWVPPPPSTIGPESCS